MKIEIILPYANASLMAEGWAAEEENVNFRDPVAVTRCTVSYAATELKKYLEKTLVGEVVICSAPTGEAQMITLAWEKDDAAACDYRLIPEETGVRIWGEGRIGVLYGAYEFLKLQGWRWYEPGQNGEVAPAKTDRLVYPEKEQVYKTNATLGRGFAIEGLGKESAELLLWMARNRLNLAGNGAHTGPLMKKLGIISRDGGHIFEKILNPDRVLPSGKTLWQAHPEWYGTPTDWPFCKENALYTQFCVSQPDLLDFLSEELLQRIMGKWKNADEIDIWGFDTWGSVCNCEKCKKLGNGTDQNLHMASHFREYLNKARREGRLDRNVKLVLCGYEGTCTLQVPEKPVPQNLIDAGDFILYAPIVRCYEHSFADANCSYNRFYNVALQGWSKIENSIDVMVLEYYNVSKFEDLPLLFTKTMQKDFAHYDRSGVRGYSYMHLPLVNWGLRTLTQLLFAELSWNPRLDTEAFVAEYLENRYGKYHRQMAAVYADIEQAGSMCTSWRAWKKQSVLRQFILWDGAIPTEPLQVDDHFGTPEKLETIGAEAVKKLRSAYEQVEEILYRAKNAYQPAAGGADAVNPIEQMKKQRNNMLLHALGEDKRLLIYGLDTMELMLVMGKYYNALYARNFDLADTFWQQIEALESKLESYYVPLTFRGGYAEIYAHPALTRTQLAETIQRCRAFRNSQK